MNIIIPMAGRGSRLRPHTLTTPKPLVHVAGKPIVEWLAEDIISFCPESPDTIGFVIGDFGKEVEQSLLDVAQHLGAKGKIYHQDKPLGTAHAIMCAQELLTAKTVVAFADTLFRTDYVIDTDKDGVIFVQQVEDPSAYGVVTLSPEGYIQNFVEKPSDFVSDLAIVGIYYFKDGAKLKSAMQYLLDNNITTKGEYQLTDAMEMLKKEGVKYYPGTIDEWLDCGNKAAVVHTNKRWLDIKSDALSSLEPKSENSVIIPPCHFGKNVTIKNAIVGPYVSIGENSEILNSVIANTLIQNGTYIANKVIHNAMIGAHASVIGNVSDYSISDYSEILE